MPTSGKRHRTRRTVASSVVARRRTSRSRRHARQQRPRRRRRPAPHRCAPSRARRRSAASVAARRARRKALRRRHDPAASSSSLDPVFAITANGRISFFEPGAAFPKWHRLRSWAASPARRHTNGSTPASIRWRSRSTRPWPRRSKVDCIIGRCVWLPETIDHQHGHRRNCTILGGAARRPQCRRRRVDDRHLIFKTVQNRFNDRDHLGQRQAGGL